MSKLVLVGPVYPYKGGISHYTGLLYRALAKKHEVRMISYSMQYPKLLFKKEQRDYSNDAFKVPETEFLINTADPFNILRTAELILRDKPDAALIEWWHPYFAPCYMLLSGRLKKSGVRILFTCHNVFPHERFVLDKLLTRLTLSKGDGFVLHSREEAEELVSIKPDAKYRINPHPTYQAFSFSGMTKKEARELLKLKENAKMALFFGFVREYKGLRHLIKALSILRKRESPLLSQGFVLYVAGDFAGREEKEKYLALIDDEGVSSYINITDGYIPDREVEKYFSACDVCVLPYESATQSGIVQIAFGFDRPVIATRVGGLPDVIEDGVTGLLVDRLDDQALASALEAFFEEGVKERLGENISERKQMFSWERMVDTIGELL